MRGTETDSGRGASRGPAQVVDSPGMRLQLKLLTRMEPLLNDLRDSLAATDAALAVDDSEGGG